MKPPLSEVALGEELTSGDLPADDAAFLRLLGGPTLIRQRGRDPSRVRCVSTLLHGNEPSGLRAVIRFLRSGEQPATDVLFFIGAVGTALAEPRFTHRSLPGEADANRCWTGPADSPQGRIAVEVLERFRRTQPECLVDIHNNTGHNPAYGVTFGVRPEELAIVSIFADRLVHTPIEMGTLVEATHALFPSVTVECGRAGDPAADEAAFEGLERYLGVDEIDFRRPKGELLLLDSPLRVRALPEIDLEFGESADPSVSLTISIDIDRHNFERLPPGSPIGWTRPGSDWPIEAVGADGLERSRAIFEVDDGVLRTREEFVPVMMTTNRVIAKSDCLFYAVQPVGVASVAGSGEIMVTAEEGAL